MDQHQTSLPTTALAMFLAAKGLLYPNIRSDTRPLSSRASVFCTTPSQRWRLVVMMSILWKERKE